MKRKIKLLSLCVAIIINFVNVPIAPAQDINSNKTLQECNVTEKSSTSDFTYEKIEDEKLAFKILINDKRHIVTEVVVPFKPKIGLH